MRTFRSDNNAGICPEAMQAILDSNDGSHVTGYGDDVWTQRAVEAFRNVFGQAAEVFLVASGTAANTLAIAALTQPWQHVLCHAHSHCHGDESTAPERITHCRVIGIHSSGDRITLDDFHRAALPSRGDVHQTQPGVLSISNSTEFGTVYQPDEVRALCEAAHERGYRVHIDGARFANAVASVGCDPKALTIDAGVDAMSFGGTKNGLAFGEAVLLFPQGDGAAAREAAATMPFHRKATAHLLSKHRFLAAPFEAVLKNGAWIRHAAHANAMARLLRDGLSELGLKPRFPVEANAVFVSLLPHVDRALQRKGHGYYPFGDPAWNVHRLMCSFNTTPDDVARLLGDIAAALAE